jgi:formate--tetrahydrofolate ligase
MGVKSDIEIAQEAQMLDIREVAAKVGVAEDDLGSSSTKSFFN